MERFSLFMFSFRSEEKETKIKIFSLEKKVGGRREGRDYLRFRNKEGQFYVFISFSHGMRGL